MQAPWLLATLPQKKPELLCPHGPYNMCSWRISRDGRKHPRSRPPWHGSCQCRHHRLTTRTNAPLVGLTIWGHSLKPMPLVMFERLVWTGVLVRVCVGVWRDGSRVSPVANEFCVVFSFQRRRGRDQRRRRWLQDGNVCWDSFIHHKLVQLPISGWRRGGRPWELHNFGWCGRRWFRQPFKVVLTCRHVN